MVCQKSDDNLNFSMFILFHVYPPISLLKIQIHFHPRPSFHKSFSNLLEIHLKNPLTIASTTFNTTQ
ncbi:MAG: hypothetical protein LBT66_09510 [Methanobrevibacter sp.]|nr:hypothetical protein [Candidatus Methanovirga meridionalis]